MSYVAMYLDSPETTFNLIFLRIHLATKVQKSNNKLIK